MNPTPFKVRPKRLTNLVIREVSSVDRGAGEGVKVTLMKRDDDDVDVDDVDKTDELPEPLAKAVLALYKSASSILGDAEMDDVEKQNALSTTFEQFDSHMVAVLKAKKKPAADDADVEDGTEGMRQTESDESFDQGDVPMDEMTDSQRRRAEMRMRHERAARMRRRLHKEDDDMHDMLRVAKNVAAGMPTQFTKKDFHNEIAKRAEAERLPGETSEAAYARHLTQTESGRLLYAAFKRAPQDEAEPAPTVTAPMPTPTRAYERLMQKAEALRESDPKLSTAQAFTKVYEMPGNRQLVEADKAERASRAA